MSDEMTDRPSNAMKLRLGWLEAFVATANHLSYEGAAKDVGIDAPSVKLNVEKLERWLHRVLILDGVPLELHDTDDIYFLSTATEYLRTFAAHKAGQHGPLLTVPVRKSKTSGIRLADIQSFIKAAEFGSYKEAAFEIGISHDQIRRNIASLEKALNKKLLAGRTIIHPTADGEIFLRDAIPLIARLLSSRAVIPSNYDPNQIALEDITKLLERRRTHISSAISKIEMKAKLSKIDRYEISENYKILKELDRLLLGLSGLEGTNSAP